GAGTCVITPTSAGSPLTLTATYAGDTNFNGSASAGESHTVIAPDLTAVKSNNVGGVTTLGDNWTWTIAVTNTGTFTAAYTSGQTILSDNLPDANITYNLTTTSISLSAPNSGTVDCSINGTQDLICTANGAVTLGLGGAFEVQLLATPSAIGTFANPRGGGSCTVDPGGVIVESDESNNTCGPDSVNVAPASHTYVDPAGGCGGNTPCFTSPQQALDNTAANGTSTISGTNNITASLISANSGANNVTVDGTGTLNWTGGAGALFAVGDGAVTIKGLNLSNAPTVFDQTGIGVLTAYANNILTFTTAYAGAGTPAIGHNFWGTNDPTASAPAGMLADEWPKRLGAPVGAWSDGIGPGGASLVTGINTATLSGGSGTDVIVSYGRGLANAPFGNGITPYANQMCSDYYDFFTVGGSGTYTATVPVDNTANCNTNTLNAKKVFWITTTLSLCSPASNTACWGLVPTTTLTVNISGQNLVIAGLTVAQLGGTSFVAGDTGGDDPTAITLREIGATSNIDGRGWLIVLLGLSVFVASAIGLALRRRTHA
ncbi:MAG TPA: hypothetical protein VII92_00480, partial [Anaerolineae bacterium]